MFKGKFRLSKLVCVTAVAHYGIFTLSSSCATLNKRLLHVYSECDRAGDAKGVVRDDDTVKNVVVIGNLTSGKSTFVNSITDGNIEKVRDKPDLPLFHSTSNVTIGEVDFRIWEINSLRYLTGQSYLKLMEDLVKLTNTIKTASLIIFVWNGYSLVVDDVLSFQLVPFFNMCWPHATTLIVSTGLAFEEGRERDTASWRQEWESRCPPGFHFHFLAGKFWSKGLGDSETRLVKTSIDQVRQWILDHALKGEPLACNDDQLEATADKCLSAAYSFPEAVTRTSEELKVPSCAVGNFDRPLTIWEKVKLQLASRRSKEKQMPLSECIIEVNLSKKPTFSELVNVLIARNAVGKSDMQENGMIPFIMFSLAFIIHCIRKAQ
jgi:hypothetical protein